MATLLSKALPLQMSALAMLPPEDPQRIAMLSGYAVMCSFDATVRGIHVPGHFRRGSSLYRRNRRRCVTSIRLQPARPSLRQTANDKHYS